LIEVKEREIVLVGTEDITEGLGDYLSTYVKLYNDTVGTFEWIKDKVARMQRREWEATIKSLKEIVLVLQAGFSPCTPPKNWASGALIQYLAPIPAHVRENIDKAEPILGLNRILVFDPNTEHFQRPKKTDPVCTGFVDLADTRHHFLLGMWDLDADMKFMDGTKLNTSSRNVGRLVDAMRTIRQDQTKNGDYHPAIQKPYLSLYPQVDRGTKWAEWKWAEWISNNTSFTRSKLMEVSSIHKLGRWENKMLMSASEYRS
jgi:hypothetical protein